MPNSLPYILLWKTLGEDSLRRDRHVFLVRHTSSQARIRHGQRMVPIRLVWQDLQLVLTITPLLSAVAQQLHSCCVDVGLRVVQESFLSGRG